MCIKLNTMRFATKEKPDCPSSNSEHIGYGLASDMHVKPCRICWKYFKNTLTPTGSAGLSRFRFLAIIAPIGIRVPQLTMLITPWNWKIQANDYAKIKVMNYRVFKIIEMCTLPINTDYTHHLKYQHLWNLDIRNL